MTGSDRTPEVPVVIAGAGPAGLVAAITMAGNGIGSLLVERNPSLSPLPRATGVSIRTMELLRSWGLEDEVRAGQLDLTYARGFATGSLASPEGTAVPAGFPDFEEAAAASPTTAAGVPQDHLEPVLLGHLRGPAGAEELVRAGWLVGADGAVLARPDAQVIAHWPTAPADLRAELAAASSGWVKGGLVSSGAGTGRWRRGRRP
jgi:flavin-dependent dehydrogenase